MNRFYLPPTEFTHDLATLNAEESHHARNVMRLQVNDKLTVFNGIGSEASASIVSSDEDAVRVRVGNRTKALPLRCEITLVQAIPKGKNMELIIQKAVELGVSRIAPLLSDRTVVRLEKDEIIRKQLKWQAIALEACKQSGQNYLPEIMTPMSIKDFLAQTKPSQFPLIASLQPDASPIKDRLKESIQELGERPSTASILVGPEGDFTPAETGLAKSAGYRPVTLGPIILRTETAAIYCMSVLAYELF